MRPRSKGAFTHALALAYDESHFRQLVVEELHGHCLVAVEFSDVAPMADYLAEGRISDEIEQLAEDLCTGRRVKFDTFDAYDQDAV